MASALYMDAVIRPNRSLSRRGFKIVLGVVVTANVLVGIFLLAHGAWPIPLFLGLDVLAVWLAFRASFRAAERSERVRVSAEQVTVTLEAPGSRRRVWTSPTAFTRVLLEPWRGGEARVRLALSGKRLTLARALTVEERGAFAQALERAILAARRERHSPQEAG